MLFGGDERDVEEEDWWVETEVCRDGEWKHDSSELAVRRREGQAVACALRRGD